MQRWEIMQNMPITAVLLVATLSLLWACWLWSRRKFYTLHAKLPGPLGLPLLGVVLELRNPDKLLQYFEKISNEHKAPFVMWLGTSCILYINDPETAETILQSPHCTNKGTLYRFFSSTIGDGVFTTNSPRWNKHRRLLNPAFGRRVIETFFTVFNEETNVLVNKFATSHSESGELYETIKKCALEIACRNVLDGIIKRMLSPWLYPDVLYRYSATKKRIDQCIGIVNKFIETLLEVKKTTATAPTSGSISVDTSEDYIEDEGITKSKSNIFIEYLRNHILQGKLTTEEVRNEANVVVAASFDTISTTIYFVCLSLALHPEYQDKLYKELTDLFPKDNDGKELNLSEVTKDHLEHMTYTEMVINEAMRLFSPVPVVLRSASADFNLRDGTVVPQGTQIAIDIFNMQRSEQVWGPYARSFDPERHFGATSPQQHPYAFIPFTKGVRMCLGNLYAMQLMKIVVGKIFLNFRVTTNAKMTDLVLKGKISLKLTHYPLCQFQPREGTAQR